MKKIGLLTMSLLGLAGSAAHAQTMEAPPQGYAPPPQGYAPPPQGYAPQQQQPVYAQQPPPQMVMQPPVVVQQQPFFCQPYSDSFKLGGEVRVTRGTACMHPDGSWELHPTSPPFNYVARGGAMFLMPGIQFAIGLNHLHHGHDDHHHHDEHHDHDHHDHDHDFGH